MKQFDRFSMEYLPIGERYSKVDIIEASMNPDGTGDIQICPRQLEYFKGIASEIKEARKYGSSVVCAFGAHTIKNGMGRILGKLLEDGWFTHICTNGAGIIHDWEFAFAGKSSEDVRANVKEGHFGTWQETGLYINLAIAIGAYEGLGYADSVGSMIRNDGLAVPSKEELEAVSRNSNCDMEKRAAALDLLKEIENCGIEPGFMKIEHRFREYSLQDYVGRSEGRFTCHPMFGHDVIYTHYANDGAAIGRTSQRDFLSYVDSISNLEKGVYLSVGSAVMSPMIFEKSLSMSRNVALRNGKSIEDFAIHVVDLQPSTWNWAKGEPPADNPAYYLRFMKTFNRMGGRVDYNCFDNKVFFSTLLAVLEGRI